MSLARNADRGQSAALAALRGWLIDQNYSSHAAESIEAHTAAEGTPTGALHLDLSDEALASAAFEAALEAVAFESDRWGSPEDGPGSMWNPLDDTWVTDDDVADLGDRIEAAGPEAVTAMVAPIAGGAPFVPTEADWEDYRRHFDGEERPWYPDDQPEPPMWGYE